MFDMKDISGLGSAFDFATKAIDKIFPTAATEAEKAQAIKNLVPILEARDTTVTQAQRDVIISEMAQFDNYTKRARPTVVYAGLSFIALVYIVIPAIIKTILLVKINFLSPGQIGALKEYMDLSLPGEFWMAWGSVVSIWSIGRSAEKNGATNKIIQMITGSK